MYPIINRVLGDIELYEYNYIIHSWIDPIVVILVFCFLALGIYKALKYLINIRN